MRKRVLWGHHVDEYRDMFDLGPSDLASRVLEYGCGPSAVNAENHTNAKRMVSVDPLFSMEKDVLIENVETYFNERVQFVERDIAQFDFSRYGDKEALLNYRQAGMQTFFDDYDAGLKAKRYLPLSDAQLPFEDFSFDIALCSHYLFDKQGDDAVAQHLAIIQELTRVAKDVRIFPLIDHQGAPTPILGPLLLALQSDTIGTEVREVPYRLQTTGHAMLRVWAQKCSLT